MKLIKGLFKLIFVCALIVLGLSCIEEKYGDNTVAVNTAESTSDTGAAIESTAKTSTAASNYAPYYDQLTTAQKSLYTEIVEAAEACSTSFVPNETVDADDVEKAFRSVFCDHPELFWLSNQYRYQYYENSGTIVSVTLQYNSLADDLETNKTAFNNSANTIIVGSLQYTSDYDKEKYIHNELLDMVTYDVNADLNQSAYSALVGHSTVCAGYARAFQYLMQSAGIPCTYVIGTSSGEDHAWNIVLIDGEYYNVDVTWDDCIGDNDRYYFFNLDDDSFNAYHSRSSFSSFLPACTSTALAHREDALVWRNIYFTVPKE